MLAGEDAPGNNVLGGPLRCGIEHSASRGKCGIYIVSRKCASR